MTEVYLIRHSEKYRNFNNIINDDSFQLFNEKIILSINGEMLANILLIEIKLMLILIKILVKEYMVLILLMELLMILMLNNGMISIISFPMVSLEEMLLIECIMHLLGLLTIIRIRELPLFLMVLLLVFCSISGAMYLLIIIMIIR